MQALQLCKQNLSEVVAAFKLFCLFIQRCNTVEEINLERQSQVKVLIMIKILILTFGG